MRRHILDTNALVTFVTDRDPEGREVIDAVLKNAASLNEDVYVISNVITEFVYVLTTVYEVRPSTVSSMVVDLISTPGVEYHHGYFPELVFRLWPAEVRDFGDAVIASAASSLGLSVYTADRKFSNELTRIGVASDFLA